MVIHMSWGNHENIQETFEVRRCKGVTGKLPKITNINYAWDVGGGKVIFYDDIDRQEEFMEVPKMVEI